MYFHRNQQRGPQCVKEGYISCVNFYEHGETTQTEAKSFRSQQKRKKPHILCLQTEGDKTVWYVPMLKLSETAHYK